MIICMTALAQAGKDTTADLLIKNMPWMHTYALAAPIKDVMCALFGWDDSHREGLMKEVEITYTITPDSLEKAGELYDSIGLTKYEAFHDCWEKLIKLFGVEFYGNEYTCHISPRQSYQLFGTEWGRAIDDQIWLKVAPTDNVIITDVRFDNEAEYFHNLGAKIVQVLRDNISKVSSHSSEAGISPDYINVVISNNKSLKDLERTVAYLAETGFPEGKYV